MAKKKTIKNVSPNLESNLVAERIDDTYETKLRSTTTFNRYAIVETEVTMKKPDDLAANYEADSAKVKVNGVEVGGVSGSLKIIRNGIKDVKDYAEVEVAVPTYNIKVVARNVGGANFKVLNTETGLWSDSVYTTNTVINAIEQGEPVTVYTGIGNDTIYESSINAALKRIADTTGTTKQVYNALSSPEISTGAALYYRDSYGRLVARRNYLVLVITTKDAA